MQYKLSKGDWEKIGIKMGWMRTASGLFQDLDMSSGEVKLVFEKLWRMSNKGDSQGMVEECTKMDCSKAWEMMKLLKGAYDYSMRNAFEASVKKSEREPKAHDTNEGVFQEYMMKYWKQAESFKACAEALKGKCPDAKMPEFVQTFDPMIGKE